MFIFAGAPLIESTQNNLKLSAPLTGITAAVVGVILSLALFFAQHVFFPEHNYNQVDITALMLALLALWLLVKRNLSIIKLVGVCAVFGFARYYLLLAVASA